MENARLHEELGRAHVVCRAAAQLHFFFFIIVYLFVFKVVCRAAVQFAQVVETFRTNSPASAFPLAGALERCVAAQPSL